MGLLKRGGTLGVPTLHKKPAVFFGRHIALAFYVASIPTFFLALHLTYVLTFFLASCLVFSHIFGGIYSDFFPAFYLTYVLPCSGSLQPELAMWSSGSVAHGLIGPRHGHSIWSWEEDRILRGGRGMKE